MMRGDATIPLASQHRLSNEKGRLESTPFGVEIYKGDGKCLLFIGKHLLSSKAGVVEQSEVEAATSGAMVILMEWAWDYQSQRGNL